MAQLVQRNGYYYIRRWRPFAWFQYLDTVYTGYHWWLNESIVHATRFESIPDAVTAWEKYKRRPSPGDSFVRNLS